MESFAASQDELANVARSNLPALFFILTHFTIIGHFLLEVESDP
jgi:hypothetical protein